LNNKLAHHLHRDNYHLIQVGSSATSNPTNSRRQNLQPHYRYLNSTSITHLHVSTSSHHEGSSAVTTTKKERLFGQNRIQPKLKLPTTKTIRTTTTKQSNSERLCHHHHTRTTKLIHRQISKTSSENTTNHSPTKEKPESWPTLAKPTDRNEKRTTRAEKRKHNNRDKGT
jgi:hypothetical protein